MDHICDSNLMQKFHLIWLHNDLDESNENVRNSVDRLKCMVKKVDLLTNIEKCIDFLAEIHHEQVFMIISGNLGQKVMPLIHDMQQIDSIYVLCTNKMDRIEWVRNWHKIRGIFTEIEDIGVALQRLKRQADQDSVSISIVADSEATAQDLDKLDPSFMYTQLLKEILIEMDEEDDEKAIEELAVYCRDLYASNSMELRNIEKFMREFHGHTAIWWYTYECFLYPLLNRSLRTLEVNVIIKMGFFLRHLHRHIEQLHKEQEDENQSVLVVYRGQALSKENFDHLLKTKGGLLSFNNFLSTSENRDISMNFARCALGKPDFMGIFYSIIVDPRVSSAPFARIGKVSYYGDTEQEILFSMNTVFRIGEIEQIEGNNRLWEVRLTLTADNDPQLGLLLIKLREETRGPTGWLRLCRLLMRLGETNKAEEVYKTLIDQTSDEPIKAYYYHQLGCVKYQQGEYHQAITYFENALELFIELHPPNHSHLATSYNSIGGAYFSLGDYEKAISLYKKSIKIRLETLPPDHPSISTAYSNIAIAYNKMGQYSEALSFYEKCRKIEENTLPPNHPDLATTYNNMGGLYDDMDEYAKALSFHEKALHIRQATLPPNHPDIAESYNNLGAVCNSMNKYAKALEFHEKALQIRQNSLSSNHPDLASSHNNIGLVYSKMGDHLKAIASHEKALEIRQKVLSANHPDIATSYNDIGVVYDSMGQYSTAVSYFENALKLAQFSLPPNHPYLKQFQNSLEIVRKKL